MPSGSRASAIGAAQPLRARLGGLIAQGFSLELAIISDGIGQFVILLHVLCWVHAERLVHKLTPLNEQQRQHQARVRGEIWEL